MAAILAVVLPALALASGCATTSATDYALKRTLVIGGAGGWDYLTYDASGSRLFISRGTHVQVIDPETGAVLGDIPDTPGVHGIALATELGIVSAGRRTATPAAHHEGRYIHAAGAWNRQPVNDLVLAAPGCPAAVLSSDRRSDRKPGLVKRPRHRFG